MGTPRTAATAVRGVPIVVVMAVLASLVAACGREPSHRLEGTYIVHGFFPHRTYGASCRGADAGYPDILRGTTVTVRDETAAVRAPRRCRAGRCARGPSAAGTTTACSRSR